MQERLGRLMGEAAVLWVGALSPIMVEARKALAKQTAETMRGALCKGVVPGGGVALLKCEPLLQEKARQAQNSDKRAAFHYLA